MLLIYKYQLKTGHAQGDHRGRDFGTFNKLDRDPLDDAIKIFLL